MTNLLNLANLIVLFTNTTTPPPQPQAIVYSQIVSNKYFTFPIDRQDTNLVYYSLTITNTTTLKRVLNVGVSQKWCLDNNITNECWILPNGTNHIILSKGYANSVSIAIYSGDLITYSFESVTNRASYSKTQISYDTVNWMDTSNTIYIKAVAP